MTPEKEKQNKCEHKRQYWNSAGFRMCNECEEILEFNGDVYVETERTWA